jgi:Ni2+-binding GTPase involved in maturation of urease and hydrogenase
MTQPSSYQQRDFERIAAGQINIVVESAPGSGKTTMIIQA